MPDATGAGTHRPVSARRLRAAVSRRLQVVQAGRALLQRVQRRRAGRRRRAAPPLPSASVPTVAPGHAAPDLSQVRLVLVGEGPGPGWPPAAGAVTRISGEVGPALIAAIDRALRDDGVVCLVRGGVRALTEDWLVPLVASIEAGAALASPVVVVTRSGPVDRPPRIREAGLAIGLGHGTPDVWRRGEGTSSASPPPGVPDAASAACVVLDVATVRAVGGLTGSDLDASVVDLSIRLGAARGGLRLVADVCVEDPRSPARRSYAHPLGRPGPQWSTTVAHHGPRLRRASGADQLHLAITASAPTGRAAARWGDWHLAEALARALQRLGHRAWAQTYDRRDDDAARMADVHLVLRGLGPVEASAGQVQVLWVISHPDSLTEEECAAADLVAVASRPFAEELSGRLPVPVVALLQATDTTRFRPSGVDPRHAHDVAVVANTRHVMRPSVDAALAGGLRPAVHGAGWREFLPADLIVAEHVPNEDLPVLYSSVGVLLNDHWEDMRRHGFVSNRIFDAVACGAIVVSDHLDEIPALLGDAVSTYDDPDDLPGVVRSLLDDRVAASRRAHEGATVIRERHSFDHRAAELVEHLARLRLVAPPV